ncbi:MAG: PD-(D/E)XK nuclease family protein [Spirochaetia bacterium]|nr:PD-(D/E)XK nuclease family protein [Spirochaetia bacterium]
MKYTSLKEDEFIKVFYKWLRPDEPTVLLCRNVMDIMRLRIYFHENYKIKSFFNVHFLTIDQWIKKILPFQKSSDKIIHTKLAEKAMIFQKVSEFEKLIESENAVRKSSAYLRELLKLPAFKNEILYLWHLYSWNRQIQPDELDIKKENDLSSEIFSLFNDVYESMKKNDLQTLPEVYISSNYNENNNKSKMFPDSEFLNIRQVLCFFPTSYNVIEILKMNFLIKNNASQWKFIFRNDLTQNNSSYGHILKPLQLSSEHEIYSIKNQDNLKPSYGEWLQKNKYFFSNDHVPKELKIRICKDTHDEYELIASSIRKLYDNGISLHSIFILYASARELPILENALKKQGLGLNHPEKYSAKTKSIISIAADLIDLLSLKSANDQLTRNQFIELFFNPVFYAQALSDSDNSHEDTIQFIYNNHEINTSISLNSLVQKMKTLKDHENFKSFVNELKNDQKKLSMKFLPSKHSVLFLQTFKKYLKRSRLPDEVFNAQMEAIHKITDSFLILDRYFAEGIEAAFYYSLLYDEISDLKLKSSGIPRDELPVVYARNVQEGVHSPIDYLFITNLTSKAFPVQSRHPDFMESSGDEIKFVLNLSATDQKRKIQDSLQMVQRGYCLTFNLQQDSAPSDFIFEQIPSEPGKIIKKEKLLADLPFFERKNKNTCMDSEQETSPDKLPISENKSSQSVQNLHQSFLSKFTFSDSNNYRQMYQNYTGLVSPENIEKVSSSGNVENLAWCPQLFHFEKIKKLSTPVNYYEERFLEKRQTGTLFHASAKNLINQLILKFPQKEYSKINKCINQNDLNKLLMESFKTGEQNLLGENKTDFEIFTRSVLNEAFEQFQDYFKNFFYLAENEKHPLYDHYPLSVELAFENIALGSFTFKGRIDRIDYCPDQKSVCVLDYKTGKSKNESWSIDDIKSLGKFQLPLYIKAICDIIKQNDNMWNVPVENIQGAYEFTAPSKKTKNTYFMEIEEENIYPIDKISGELELLLKDGLHVLSETLASGYFFSFGHKKSPEDKWESKCDFCSYSGICDRAPYVSMIKRVNSDPIAKKFLNILYPGK